MLIAIIGSIMSALGFGTANIVIKSKLQADYGFYVWEEIDQENICIRLVTSWATSESAIDLFLKDLASFS